MSDYAPSFGRSKVMTFIAGSAIVGGNLVYISAADTVSQASVANPNAIGVAGHDAAVGANVTVHMGAGIVHETTASVAVPTVGVPLYAGPTGGVSPTAGTGPIVGYSIRTALITAICRWKAVA